MRENFPPADPPASAVPPANDSEAAAHPPAGFNGPDFASQDAPGIPGAGDRPANAAANGISPARVRQVLVGLFILLAVVLAGVAAIAFVRDYRSAQALHAVARVATLPAAGQEQPDMQANAPATLPPAMPAGAPVLPAGRQASTDPAAAAATIPTGPVTVAESGPKEVATSSIADGSDVASSADMAGKAAGAVPERQRGERPRELAGSNGQGEASATPARAKVKERDGAARAGKRDASSERSAVARRATRDGGTFRRCPPLGKKGAVMCRWHICNGGAGKEPACRPYLERRP